MYKRQALLYEDTGIADVVRWTTEDDAAYRVKRTRSGIEEDRLPSRPLAT